MRKYEQLLSFESARADQKRVSRASLSDLEKAGMEAALDRCRALAQRIECDLLNGRCEHFVDVTSLAEFQAALERAASVLKRRSRRSAQTGEPKA